MRAEQLRAQGMNASAPSIELDRSGRCCIGTAAGAGAGHCATRLHRGNRRGWRPISVDLAGNPGEGSVGYTVAYSFGGFEQPIPQSSLSRGFDDPGEVRPEGPHRRGDTRRRRPSARRSLSDPGPPRWRAATRVCEVRRTPSISSHTA